MLNVEECRRRPDVFYPQDKYTPESIFLSSQSDNF